MASLTHKQKKALAKDLYLQTHYKQKEIAEKVGISEKTLSKWINTEGWKELKGASLITREQQRRRILLQIKALNDAIESRDEGERYPTPRESDTLVKLSAAVNNLSSNKPLNTIIDIFVDFLEWIKSSNLEKAQEFTQYFDDYIKEEMSKGR